MKLKLTVTFDPFEVSAPDLKAAILALKGTDNIIIYTHPAREAAKPKVAKARKIEAIGEPRS